MIPRVFHSVWVGDPMPDHLTRYLATWQQVHPGWEHRIWTDRDLDWLTNQPLFDYAEAYTSSVGQFRSDIARYEILHRYGGVYVDADFEALAPIDELLLGVDCFAAWETDDVWVGNAILGCVPEHPLMADLIAGLPLNVEQHRGERPNRMTGPQYLTPIARAHRIKLFPAAQFYPYDYNHLERAGDTFPDAYAAHRWENTRSGGRGVKRARGRNP